MSDYILMAVALLPAIVLCTYVFIKDRVEKEPIGLLLKLFALGAILVFPAATIEGALTAMLEGFFLPETPILVEEGINFYNHEAYLYIFTDNTIGIALVEEGIKFLVLICLTRKSREFDSLFDGLIYAVFVSLGFAALENVFYVWQYGLDTGIMRAVLSVPGHMFFAVMMGYHYSMWHITDKAAETEKDLKAQGIIQSNLKPFSSKKEIALCLIIPTLAHGTYNSLCTIGTVWSTLMLYAFVIFMYIHCFGKIRKMSKADELDNVYVQYMLTKKYPELLG